MKMNRKQKIEFLKALQRGEKSIKALKDGKVYIAYHYIDIDRYEISGSHKDEPLLLTPDEYADFCRQLEEHNKVLTDGQNIKNSVILCNVNSEDMRSLQRLMNE